jgi:hypothetical protein
MAAFQTPGNPVKTMTAGYRLENVWKDKPEALKDEIVRFWLAHQALPGEVQARQRVDQVIFVLRDQDNEIIGVNTAYPALNPYLGLKLFHYRVFVSPAYRNLDLATKLTVTACDFFNERFLAGKDLDIIGLFAVIESPLLHRAMSSAVWQDRLIYIGKDERGNPLRVYYFDGVRMF